MTPLLKIMNELKKNNLLVADTSVFYQFPSLQRSSLNKSLSAKFRNKGQDFNQLIKQYLETLNINQYEGNFSCQLIIKKKSQIIALKINFKDIHIFNIKIPILNDSDNYFKLDSDSITIKANILRALSMDKKTITEYQEWAFNHKFKTHDFLYFMQTLIGTSPKESLTYFKKNILYID